MKLRDAMLCATIGAVGATGGMIVNQELRETDPKIQVSPSSCRALKETLGFDKTYDLDIRRNEVLVGCQRVINEEPKLQ